MHIAQILSELPDGTSHIDVCRAAPLMDMSKAACLARLAFAQVRGLDQDGGLLPQYEMIIDGILVGGLPAIIEKEA